MKSLGKAICSKHQNSKFFITKEGRKRCSKCAGDAVSKRRRKLKEKALLMLGGKCEHCGYSKCIAALEFHHTDPTKKDFSIAATGSTRAWKKIEIELKKCKLLCSNCHREQHYATKTEKL